MKHRYESLTDIILQLIKALIIRANGNDLTNSVAKNVKAWKILLI